MTGQGGSSASTGPAIKINVGGPAVSGWVADVDFLGGNQGQATNAAIDTTGLTNPAPQAVYQATRIGAFTYTLPGPYTGLHTVRIHWAETYFPPAGDTMGGANRRLCNVVINGNMVLTNYDIFVKAGNAKMKAVIEQFTVAPDAQGQYVVQFTPTKDNCALGGLEIQ
jgi:hypothetical protein